ncbi:hypothetical protein PUR71_08265 [Streptomyces sp. SP17BM10]|uniref:hypothetical protein n=1 Tax=Streptomyces sp. SP17BM10 TaxID=3002530 RepID=UPI002E76558A|nr:hypothetical protein [Streptomyces sp. SP17BM10]MEE1782909.1 hypothetical protein [Streptomyces sp. SP17BM10]
MSVTTRYRNAWEGFWQAAPDEPGGVIWDADPSRTAARHVATLVGRRGRAFVVEPSEAAKPVLRGLAQRPDGPPPKLRPVFAHGLAPAEVADGTSAELFHDAGLTVLASGDMPLTLTEPAADGRPIDLPARWLEVGSGPRG